MLENKKESSCEDIEALLFDYIDGELDSSDSALVEAHIAKCPVCASELAQRKEMLSLVKESASDVPAELYTRVMAEVKKTPQNAKILKPKFRIKPWMSTAVAACAVIAILFAGRGYLYGGAETLDMAAPDLARAGAVVEDDALENENPGAALDIPAKDIEHVKGDNTDIVYADTDAYSGYSPLYEDAGASPDAVMPSTSVINAELINSVFEANMHKESAIIVCAYSDLADTACAADGELSAVYFGVGASVTLSAVSENADLAFAEYVKLLDSRGAFYRAYEPDNVNYDVCEIFLITDMKE